MYKNDNSENDGYHCGVNNPKNEFNEICRIVGDTVLLMSSKGYETNKQAIADALRADLVNSEKWERDKAEYINLAIKLLEL